MNQKFDKGQLEERLQLSVGLAESHNCAAILLVLAVDDLSGKAALGDRNERDEMKGRLASQAASTLLVRLSKHDST